MLLCFFYFWNPSIIFLIEMMDEIGDCNVRDYFLTYWKCIFWRVVNTRPSKSSVPWSNSSPNYVKLSFPSNLFSGSIVQVSPCAWWRCTNFCLLRHLSISSGWFRRRQSWPERFFEILSKDIYRSVGMVIYIMLLDIFFRKSADVLMNFFLLFNCDEVFLNASLMLYFQGVCTLQPVNVDDLLYDWQSFGLIF